jgi:hypothetical protein
MTHDAAVKSMATERYLLEEMSDAERDAFEEHFFSCVECAEDLRTAELMRTGAREAGRKNVVAFQPKRQPRWTVALPWAAAASLAVVVGYQSLGAPRFDAPYALEPVTLRPASRGANAVVKLQADVQAVALAVEADAPAGTAQWLYELRAGDGRQVAAGRAPVTAPGSPLLLVIPSSSLTAPGRYVLVLRVEEGGAPLVEYQFDAVSVNTSNGAQ